MTIDKKHLIKLIAELSSEMNSYGRSKTLYDHCEAFHTVKYRQEMLNHEQISKQVMSEINHLLEDKKDEKGNSNGNAVS